MFDIAAAAETAPSGVALAAEPDEIAAAETAPSGTASAGAAPDHPTVVLVHGTAADHTTWRVVGPLLARRRRVYAIDRRGRGASGDGPRSIADGYTFDLEYADLAAVVEALAAEHGGPVDVVGHSYGGRTGLGAALRTPNLRRLVVYEGAPRPDGMRFERRGEAARLQALLDAGDPEGMLLTFFGEVVGMDATALDAYRANPVWPDRVAAAPTVPRELLTASLDGPERFAAVRQPVLLVAGTAGKPVFAAGIEALGRLLAHGTVVRIPGAAHAAHHTHPDELVAAIEAFLA